MIKFFSKTRYLSPPRRGLRGGFETLNYVKTI